MPSGCATDAGVGRCVSPTATVTGPFGLFVVPGDGPADTVAIVPTEAGVDYDLVVAPFEPGFVTYAVQRGVPRP